MEKPAISGHASFWIGMDGILYGTINNSNTYTKMDSYTASSYAATVSNLSKGRPVPLLIDLRNTQGALSLEAAEVLSDRFNKMSFVICEAYVVNSLALKLQVNTFKRLYNTRSPYKIYHSLKDAQEFCLWQKDLYEGANTTTALPKTL